MSSSYTTRLGLELQADGENSNTWGQRTNNSVITLLDAAIAGITSVALSSAPITLTDQDGAADQSRSAILYLHGVLTSNCQIVVPSVQKSYVVWNGCTGAFNPILKTAGGEGSSIPRGGMSQVFCDTVSVWVDGTSVGTALFTAADASAARAAIGLTPDSASFEVSGSKLQLLATGASAASYLAPAIAVNAKGQITSISDGVASQAEAEAAATSLKVLTPANARHHPGMCKAHANWSAVGGVVSVRSAYNVSSVSRDSAGTFTIAFVSGMASVGYVSLLNGSGAVYTTLTVTPSSIRVQSLDTSFNVNDFLQNNLLIFGDM
jgi:hypothetical protein